MVTWGGGGRNVWNAMAILSIMGIPRPTCEKDCVLAIHSGRMKNNKETQDHILNN